MNWRLFRVLMFYTCVIVVCYMACTTPQQQASMYKMVYLKDPNTNLCFGAMRLDGSAYGFDKETLTCVPCDSLKKVEINLLEK